MVFSCLSPCTQCGRWWPRWWQWSQSRLCRAATRTHSHRPDWSQYSPGAMESGQVFVDSGQFRRGCLPIPQVGWPECTGPRRWWTLCRGAGARSRGGRRVCSPSCSTWRAPGGHSPSPRSCSSSQCGWCHLRHLLQVHFVCSCNDQILFTWSTLSSLSVYCYWFHKTCKIYYYVYDSGTLHKRWNERQSARKNRKTL